MYLESDITMVKMEDAEHVCPLCCEELDISDREFYPCKCGYQVCMWCWHRIRESETGLCPACRTPYGEDPHQFTALDVEEVLRANKDKEKAKREQQRHTSDGANDHSFRTTAMEVPKDRSQLANMRVIRRNLVYAVGLPPSIATEEILRKPEYFGQYGKIAKIVLNRSQTVAPEGGDPRRASASAYVTFQHKADTLACILALDGFYLENRNIRASYGTSKYCSAFIKNVRCNNPDCTYLHEMGAAEDTFTKQEIQAGYVTSGRDVLARQQQIVAEQLAQQQQQTVSGGFHSVPRKRVGGGGPSGSGKASAHPVFPPPEYDEPAKPAPSMVPPPVGITRSTSTQVAPSAAQQAALLNPATISAKLGRSASIGTGSIAASARNAVMGLGNAAPHRKSQSGGAPSTAAATTAASVVAGGRSLSKDSSDFPSALTALTPLKRSSVKAAATAKPPPVEDKLPGPTIRNGKKQNARNARAAAVAASNASNPQKPPPSSAVSSIGGNVIGPPLKSIDDGDVVAVGGERFVGNDDSDATEGSGDLASLGGLPIPLERVGGNSSAASGTSAASLLGGEIFTGSLAGHSNKNSSVIGSSLLGGVPLTSAMNISPTVGGERVLHGGNAGLWDRSAAPMASYGGSSSGVIGSHISNNSNGIGGGSGGNSSNSSSALASILGINLPTGSGSLQESPNLWSSSPLPPPQQQPSPLMALNASSMEQQNRQMIGNPLPAANSGSSLIGGVPIGGSSSFNGPGTIGVNFGGSNKSDIALLQSLLPGVHITSDSSATGFGGGNPSWTGAPGNIHGRGGTNLASGLLNPSGNWGGHMQQAPSTGSSVGAIGQNSGQQNQRQGSGIW